MSFGREGDLVTRSARPAGRRRPGPLTWLALGLVLLVGAGVALWFILPIRTVTVSGNRQLTAARARQLAGADQNFGWLYYGAWRAEQLTRSPWVRSVKITKVFPDKLNIELTERRPGARLMRDGREVAIDWDGTVLPGGALTGPHISGWGPERRMEALQVARLLARYNVESVAYTPSGFTVQTAQGTAWSGSVLSLRKYAGGVTMYPGKRINIYPWGVSVQE